MSVRNLLIAAALAGTALTPATAAVIVDLYSTGVDGAGVATTGNGADLHWLLAGGPTYTGGTNGLFPIGPWVPDSATSRWLSPTGNAADTIANGTYTFTTTFDLTGYDSGTASIGGQFAADDSATIFLNGVQIFQGGGYTSFTGFNATSGFIAGVNTLSFVVMNSGGGPTGVNVVVTGDASLVPEPAAWGLMIVGFGMVGFAARRRPTRIVAA